MRKLIESFNLGFRCRHWHAAGSFWGILKNHAGFGFLVVDALLGNLCRRDEPSIHYTISQAFNIGIISSN